VRLVGFSIVIYYDARTYERQIYYYTLSLTSALDGAGCQGHVPATLPPGKRPSTLCVGSWVGLRLGLE
jgi:hypothetical protein